MKPFALPLFLLFTGCALAPRDTTSTEPVGSGEAADKTVAEPPDDATCADVDTWIAAHRVSLPRDYDGLARYPMDVRRAIFDVLSPEEQSAVFRAQIDRAHGPHLTPEQRDVLDRAIQIRGPDYFLAVAAGNGDDSATESLLERDAKRLFGWEGARKLIAQIGPDDDTRVPRRATCGCSTASDMCPLLPPKTCRLIPGGCAIRQHCGWDLLHICNGVCGGGTTPPLQ